MEDVSVVLWLKQIIDDALLSHCTDIHLTRIGHQLVVEFRNTGVVTPYAQHSDMGPSIFRRIKALARMNTTEMRVPQDGAFQWDSDVGVYNIRVAVLPIVNGEAMVLRILGDQKTRPLTLLSLGMERAEADAIQELLRQKSGLILVSGRTGAGKSTTLYALMGILAGWGRRVISLEDPVEIQLDACWQMEVREEMGITFATGLRAILRHDPDAIMVGEIRDQETAATAVRAALTGQVVLSTLHARDVIGVIARLLDLGISRTFLANALKAVIVQEYQEQSCCSNGTCPSCAGTGVQRDPHMSFVVHKILAPVADLIESGASFASLRRQGTGL